MPENTIGQNPEKENAPRRIELVRPAVDQFFDEPENSFLPPEIANNLELRNEAATRSELFALLGKIFTEVPDVGMDLEKAAKEGLLRPGELSLLYNRLSDFIEADKNNARIILYLPFELLPEAGHLDEHNELSVAEKRFLNVYLKGWKALLYESEVRAHFVDGNVVEPELSGKPPRRVRKAAHLAPFLVKKGILSETDITELAETADDELKESLKESLNVIHDQKLAEETADQKSLEKETARLGGKALIDSLLSDLSFQFKKIEERYQFNQSRLPANLQPRVEWERSDGKLKAIDLVSKEVKDGLAEKRISLSDLEYLSNIGEAPAIAGIRAIRDQVEEMGQDQVSALFSEYDKFLKNLWLTGTGRIKDEVATLWSHLLVLGIIPEKYLEQFGLNVPKLDDTDSKENILPESDQIKEAIQKIEEDPELASAIYPILLLTGSRFKGYARGTSDLDIAILTKPGAELGKRNEIKSRVKSLISEFQKGEIVDFWTEKQEDKLKIKDTPAIDTTLATSDWADSILGGFWFGDSEVIKDLFGKLVSNYIFEGREQTGFGVDKRTIRLRTIEQQALQYRLMHTGYDRFYPRRGGIKTEHSDGIDGNSAFYDSGYRRVATKLFLRKVFYPKIDSEMKNGPDQ